MKIGIQTKKQYRDLSEIELRKLAKDIVLGLVFTSNHLEDEAAENGEGELVFLPLLFLKQKDIDVFNEDPIGLMYEYMANAGPKQVNGRPVFRTVCFLSVPQANRVMDFVQQYSKELAGAHLDHVAADATKSAKVLSLKKE